MSESASDAHKVLLIEAINELKDISRSETSLNRDNRRQVVDAVVGRFDDPDDVETLASLCLAMSRHCESPECANKGNSELRNVFEIAYWNVIERLAQNKEKNKDVLDHIKYRSQLDGGDEGDWLRIVEGKQFP